MAPITTILTVSSVLGAINAFPPLLSTLLSGLGYLMALSASGEHLTSTPDIHRAALGTRYQTALRDASQT